MGEKRRVTAPVAGMHVRIRDLRRRNGLTQEHVAAQCGVSKAAVSHWECGVSMPRGSRLIALAKLLRTTISEIYGDR